MLKKNLFGKGTTGVRVDFSNSELFLLANLVPALRNNEKSAIVEVTNFLERLTLTTGIEQAYNELFKPVEDEERLGGLKETKSRINEEDIFNED